jgi:hypothetical protein
MRIILVISMVIPFTLGGVKELVPKEAEPIVLNIVASKNYENKGQ